MFSIVLFSLEVKGSKYAQTIVLCLLEKKKKIFFFIKKTKKKLSKCFEARWNLRICIYSKIDFEQTHLDVS
jgi:hypothetical protein